MNTHKSHPKKRHRNQFNPYVFNGGSSVAIHGTNYAIIASDTRLSNGSYGIQTRYCSKMVALTSRCVLSSVGCQSDCSTLHKDLEAKLKWYKHQHNKEMSIDAIAQLLSNTLYGRRFFPYYAFCMIAGINEKGEGVSYGYDAIGSKSEAGADGSGQKLLQPLLDNQLNRKNQLIVPGDKNISYNEAISLVKDSFQSAGERDIYTGDSVEIFSLIANEGIKREVVPLKFD